MVDHSELDEPRFEGQRIGLPGSACRRHMRYINLGRLFGWMLTLDHRPHPEPPTVISWSLS